MNNLRVSKFNLAFHASSLLFCALISGAPAFAFSPQFNLGFENDLSRNTVSPSDFPILSAGTTFDSNDDDAIASSDEYHGDITLKISPTHPKAYTLISRNLFYGEKDQSYDSPLRFSYGRRVIGWSKLDEMWSLGEYEPLDSWDRLRPSTQGLTGIFAYTETQKFNFRLFLSYLFMPEITPNVVIENNQFVNEHPQAVSTAPQSFNLLNRSTPLGYQLEIPSIDKIIFRPSFVFMMETKREIPFYAKFVYGYLPLNYFPIALQASFAIPLDQIVVQLRPRLINHSLYNAETAYRFSDSFSLGLTAMIDQPVADAIPSDYTTTPLTTSFNLSPWAQYQLPGFKLIITQLWTTGGLDADVGPYANPNSSAFSSRILYRNATQIAVKTEVGNGNPHHPTLQVKYVHEYSVLADWIAADFYYSLHPKLLLFAGGDLISARRDVSPDRGAEFLADMRAIDRIRVGVNYAF